MASRITILPTDRILESEAGENLLSVLRTYGTAADALCPGSGAGDKRSPSPLTTL